jgi:signal transduction histidine kinase
MSRRLLLSYLSLTLFVLLVLELPLAVSYARNERHDLSSKVERDAVALGTLAEDALENNTQVDQARLKTVLDGYARSTGARVVVVDSRGVGMVDTDPPVPGERSFASRPEFAHALGGQVATGTRHSDTLGANILYVAVPVASGGMVHGAIRITYPTSAIDARVHRYWLMLAAIAAVVLGAASLVALRFARATVRPLAELERAAAAAGAGDLEARAPVEGPPEIRSLARRFNEMVARLDELLRTQDEFVADASHELRSPLAALRLGFENLEGEIGPENRPTLEIVSRELERLSRAVEALLALARADRRLSEPARVDVGAVVEDRIALWSPLCDERAVTLVSSVEEGLTAHATPGGLDSILDNLLANALEASPAGGTVTLSATRLAEWAEIRVSDEGPGMTSEDLSRAFDRFWRANSESEGSGLGLAIVRRLVTADGGQVELRSGATAGVDAVVRLPLGPRRRRFAPPERPKSFGLATSGVSGPKLGDRKPPGRA